MAMGPDRISTCDELRARFEEWRRTRQGRAGIPEELWAAAVEVARRDGVNRTAVALRLDGAKLKRLMAAADAVSGRAVPPAFVELVTAGGVPAAVLPEYTLEVEGRRGKLRIHCKGVTTADVAGLSRALWEVAC
jgi:hypothetical protein